MLMQLQKKNVPVLGLFHLEQPGPRHFGILRISDERRQ